MTFSGDRPGAQTSKNALPEGSFLFAFLARKSSQVALKYRGGSILINFKNLSLPRNRFRGRFSVVRIKRESGENPGQSRCCEAPFQHPENYFCHWFMVINREGFGMGVSQKTCRSLKAILSSWVRRMVRKCF